MSVGQTMEALIDTLLALRLSWPLRYALATLLIAVVTGLQLLLADTLESHPYLLYFPVIIICGLMLDYGTSLYATFLCAFLAVFLFVEPRYEFVIASTRDGIAFLLFLMTGLVISGIIEVLRLGAARLKISRDETRQALEERDLLLRELVHRVKNDLQAASFLLRIQSSQSSHPATREALADASERISIMTRVHTRLAHREHGERINLGDFLRDLAADFEATQIGSRLVTLRSDVADIPVDQKQAVYLGLIVNELLTNALKYAFPNDRIGRIAITLAKEDGHLRLAVADNGVGVPPDIAQTQGLGTGLVDVLGGTLDVNCEQGMSCTVRIPAEP